jgi:hypothetical protein
MRRKIIGTVAVLGLVASGAAIAATDAATTTPVTATFSATPSPNNTTKTCTGADGTYHVTNGTYTGTITSSDPRLNGNIVIDARSVVNITTGYGFTVGTVHLSNPATGAHGDSELSAVNTSNGKLDGFLLGHVDDPSQLYANFSAAFNSDGTSLNGELGQDSPVPPDNSAVIFSGHLDCS